MIKGQECCSPPGHNSQGFEATSPMPTLEREATTTGHDTQVEVLRWTELGGVASLGRGTAAPLTTDPDQRQQPPSGRGNG